jgi:hypothetical protein
LFGSKQRCCQYRGVGGKIAVETFTFGLEGKVIKANANYEVAL